MLAPGDTPEIQAYDTRTRLEFYAQALDIDDRAVAERMLDRLGEDDLEVREIFAEDPAALRDGLLGGGVRYANAPELSHALTAEGRTKELERIWDESRTETIIDAYAEQMPDRAEALRGEAFDMQMDEMESDLKTELHEQIEEALEAGWINEARDLMERNQEAFTDLELNALTEKYDAALTEWGEAEYERVLAKEIDDHIKIELEELERQPEAAQEAEAEQVRQPQHEEGRSQSGGGLSL